jgi:hypothetical protein
MRIIAKKYDGITYENTSELGLARLQSDAGGRTYAIRFTIGNPDTSRDGDTERHI